MLEGVYNFLNVKMLHMNFVDTRNYVDESGQWGQGTHNESERFSEMACRFMQTSLRFGTNLQLSVSETAVLRPHELILLLLTVCFDSSITGANHGCDSTSEDFMRVAGLVSSSLLIKSLAPVLL
jgi:hypothetical protein